MDIKETFYKLKEKIFSSKNDKENNFINFQFLVPSKNAEKVEVYVNSLNIALKNDDVKNIAISGSYGAGKSSFIKTFENKNPQYNFLDVSLATFNKKNTDKKDNVDTDKNGNTDFSLIEKSILQQIFYKVEQKSVPFSRFKRINKVIWLIPKTLLALLCIGALFIFFDSKSLNSLEFFQGFKIIELSFWNFLQTPISLDIKLVALLVILIGSFIFIKLILKNFTGIALDKLNLQNLEISTNKDDESSLLNKYLDEILYFFSETKYNIVVFQDLDRFDNIEIFTKLRELNSYLNNSEQINKKIVFLYAIKDEMFKDDDSRTKFFDFMIPIIPYVNSSTSYDKLLDFFEDDLKDEDKFDKVTQSEFKEFLRDIALYIKDMRLLKNIYNEYKIYDEKIGEENNKVKLLAIIVYKNFYPEDFSLLHKDDGYVIKAFKSKNIYIKSVDTNYSKKIEALLSEIKQIESEQVQSVDELRKVYIFSIISKLSNPQYLRIANSNIVFQNAIVSNNFNLIKNSDKITNPSNANLYTTFKTVEDELNQLSYDDREQLIRDKKNHKIQNLHNQIDDIKRKQKELNTQTLSKLCDSEEVKIFIENKIKTLKTDADNEIKNSDLLFFLLFKGHVDENYYMFLSYSFNKSLTPSDTAFLKSIINENELSYNHKLVNINELLNKLRLNEYEKVAILNYDLVSFLIENKNKFHEQYEAIFKQLSNGSKKSIKFIFDYLDSLPKQNKFIEETVKYWKTFWEYIYTSDDLILGQKENYFYQLLDNLSASEIIELNQNNSLKTFIENLTQIKDLVHEDNEKIKKLINELDIHFVNLTEPISNTALFEYIYQNSHFILNKLMIEQIIYTRYGGKDSIEEALYSKHLTTIINLDKDNKLIEAIENNIDIYINDIFLLIDTNTNESEETIIWLLNNTDLNNEQKIEIIDSQDTIIADISKVNDSELLETLFVKNKVSATWNNISLFYNLTKEFNNTLISYLSIQGNAEKLSNVRVGVKYCEEHNDFDTQVLRDIAESNDIETSSYKTLIKSNGYWYKSLELCSLGEDKIDILIDGGKLQLTNENIEKLIECSLSKHIILIEKQFDVFIEKIDELKISLSGNDFIKFFESSTLSDVNKFKLLETIDIYSLDIDEKLSTNLSELFFRNKEVMEFTLLKTVISNLNEKDRLGVLVFQLAYNDEFECSEIDELLSYLSSPYDELCKHGNSYIKLNNNQNNKTLVEILDNNGCISSFSIKKTSIRVNRFRS